MVALPLAVSVFGAATAQAGVPPECAHPPEKPAHEVGGFVPWMVGVDRIFDSTGKIGVKANVVTGPSGFQAGIVGINKQSSHLGPAYFDLDILKSATFTYTPGGKKPGGHKPGKPGHGGYHVAGPEAKLDLVDIGKWGVGIPGFLEWVGEIGFKANVTAGPSGISGYWMGVNKQYVRIGPLTVGFDFQPTISLNLPTPGYTSPADNPGHDGGKPGHDGGEPGHDGGKPGHDADKWGHGGNKPGYGRGDPRHEGDKPHPVADKYGSGGNERDANGDQPRISDGMHGQGGGKLGRDGDEPRANSAVRGQRSNYDTARMGVKPGWRDNGRSYLNGGRPGPSSGGSDQGGGGSDQGGGGSDQGGGGSDQGGGSTNGGGGSAQGGAGDGSAS